MAVDALYVRSVVGLAIPINPLNPKKHAHTERQITATTARTVVARAYARMAVDALYVRSVVGRPSPNQRNSAHTES